MSSWTTQGNLDYWKDIGRKDMDEITPHYEAGYGIRDARGRSRASGKVRGVAREIVAGGGMELWACQHDHAPGVRDCRQLTTAQRKEAAACAAAWAENEITAGARYPMPVEWDA